MKILLVEPEEIGGVYYHRQYVHFKEVPKGVTVERIRPFGGLQDFAISNPVVFKELDTFNLIYFTRTLPGNGKEDYQSLVRFFNENGVSVVLDIDDYWAVPRNHLLYNDFQINKSPEKNFQSIACANYITTSTKRLASIIIEKTAHTSKTVGVVNNSIDFSEKQFADTERYDARDERVRFGYAGSICHYSDVKMLEVGIETMHNTKGLNYQFVLGGFSLSMRANYITLGFDGSRAVQNNVLVPIERQEFFKYEKVFTANHSCLSPFAKRALTTEGYLKDGNDELWKHVEAVLARENYRRIWAGTPQDYAFTYNYFDVALAPLCQDMFNSYKSSLKLIEAGAKGICAVASDVEPYRSFVQDHGKDVAILVKPNRNKTDWFKAFKSLIQSESLRKEKAQALSELVRREYTVERWRDIKFGFLHGCKVE